MHKVLIPALVALSLSAVDVAHAQQCREGRTFAGACVKPELAQTARKRSIVFSQIELSKTAPIYLPNDDRKYIIPFNYFEMLKVINAP